MPSPGWIEIRAVSRWNGEKVEARDAVPAEAWANETVREQVKQHLRYSIAQGIAERMNIAFTVDHHPLRYLRSEGQ